MSAIRMQRNFHVGLFGVALFGGSAVVIVHAAELQPRTIEAFDRYMAATEVRMATERGGDVPFLWVDRQPEPERVEALRRLEVGEVVIERLQTRDSSGKDIKIPKGMVHHWVGTVRIPEVTLEETIAMGQDYRHYADIYSPHIRQSALLGRDGNRFRFSLQLHVKKIVTVVVNAEYDAVFELLDARRAWVPTYATRIAEVENPNTPEEREKPIGDDRGFLWRLNTHCSFEQRDADTYMQCEVVSLSRGMPFLLSAFIKPFVSGIPKETLSFTLESGRGHLTDSGG